MNCRTAVERIDEFLDGLLPADEADRMRAHVAECESCTRELRAAERFRGFLAGTGHEAIESRLKAELPEHGADAFVIDGRVRINPIALWIDGQREHLG